MLSTNTPATVIVTSNDFGLYVCTVTNECGMRTSTLRLEPVTCKSKCIECFRKVYKYKHYRFVQVIA